MPTLKRPKEPETYELGKAVTTIISSAKELHKTVNGLLDQVEYVKSRKKQEEQDLERIINEKSDVLKLKTELTEKIIAKKSEFLEFVGSKQTELEAREADLVKNEASLTEDTARLMQDVTDRQNELGIQISELEKKKSNLAETVKQELRIESEQITERKRLVTEAEEMSAKKELELAQFKRTLNDKTQELEKMASSLKTAEKQLDSRIIELDNREKTIAEQEQKAINTRKGIAQTVADMENQISIIESERNKNEHDRKLIQEMQIALGKRTQDLDIREIHLNDRAATQLTH